MFGLRHLDILSHKKSIQSNCQLYCSVKIFLSASFTIVWPPTKSTCRNMSNSLQTDLPKIFLRHEYLKQRRLLDSPGVPSAAPTLVCKPVPSCRHPQQQDAKSSETGEESCVKASPGKMRCTKETVWIPGARCNRKVPNYGWIQNWHSLSNSRWQGLTHERWGHQFHRIRHTFTTYTTT